MHIRNKDPDSDSNILELAALTGQPATMAAPTVQYSGASDVSPAVPLVGAVLRSQRFAYLILGVTLLTALPFGWFAYNAGFGYDALEYLIIGRSLHDGFGFYDFVPSKSPGIYLVVAGLIGMGLDLGHAQLATTIAAIYAATVFFTFWALKKVTDAWTAAIGCLLVALCAWFMELGFLQPTAFIYLFGLAGYLQCVRALDTRDRVRSWFWCGFWIAIAMQFKTVAAFYGAAALVALLLWSGRKDRLVAMASLATGALLPTLAVWLFFAVTGRGADYLQWTFLFPLFEYPANTDYIAKLYTKLLFFVVLFVVTTLYSLHPAIRAQIWRSNAMRTAFLFGALSTAALLKTQASHYFYPAATFLCFVAARVLAIAFETTLTKHPWRALTFAAVAMTLLGASVWLYQPAAVARLFTLRDYSHEERLRAYVERYTKPSQRIIAIRNSTNVYWLTHRYPNIPLISMDVQSTRYLELHGGVFDAALKDPNLACVEIEPNNPELEDSRLLQSPLARKQMDSLARGVAREFVKKPQPPPGFVFWCRK